MKLAIMQFCVSLCYFLSVTVHLIQLYFVHVSAGRPGFDSRQGHRIYLFATVSRLALGPTQPPIHWVPGAISAGVKWPVPEANHVSPSSVEVKNAWSYTSPPPYFAISRYLYTYRKSLWRGNT
jgi:hypothetical protein